MPSCLHQDLGQRSAYATLRLLGLLQVLARYQSQFHHGLPYAEVSLGQRSLGG